jgi:hypothetical protein
MRVSCGTRDTIQYSGMVVVVQVQTRRANIPSQRASHLGRPGSWRAIYVAWQVHWTGLSLTACASGSTIRDVLPSPCRLAPPPCWVGGCDGDLRLGAPLVGGFISCRAYRWSSVGSSRQPGERIGVFVSAARNFWRLTEVSRRRERAHAKPGSMWSLREGCCNIRRRHRMSDNLGTALNYSN